MAQTVRRSGRRVLALHGANLQCTLPSSLCGCRSCRKRRRYGTKTAYAAASAACLSQGVRAVFWPHQAPSRQPTDDASAGADATRSSSEADCRPSAPESSQQQPQPQQQTNVRSLPSEVLCSIAAHLRDPQDCAALAASFGAARAAVSASSRALRLPAAALLLGPPAVAASRVEAALRRNAGAARLEVAGMCPAALGGAEAVAALLSGLPRLHGLVRVDVSAAPPAFFERLPAPLLRSLAAGCPQLQELAVSASLWHAPARASVARVMARAAAGWPWRTDEAAACPKAAAAAGSAVNGLIDWELVGRQLAAPPAMDRWGPARPQQQADLASALLQQAMQAQAQRDGLGSLSGMRQLRSLAVAGSLPVEVAAQLPMLPPSLSRLVINCTMLVDDESLGRALGGVTGLSQLVLQQLPSADGQLFTHMTGLVALTSLEVSGSLIGTAALTPLSLSLPHLETLQLTGCTGMHSLCRAQLPEQMTQLTRLATLYLDFTLHVRDVQVLVELPSLTAMAASQLHACVSSHYAGKGFMKLRRLALHSVEHDACTCLAAPVDDDDDGGGGGGEGEGAPWQAGRGDEADPPQPPQHAAAPGPAAATQAGGGGHGASQQQQHHARRGGGRAAEPVVERVGLLVALCPALQQLSVGCGNAAVLRSIERHASLHQLVIHGQTPAAPAGTSAAQPSQPHRRGGSASDGAGGWGGSFGQAPLWAAIEGQTWGLLRRGLPRLARLCLMNVDVLLGGSPSPALLMLALSDRSAVRELRLMRYGAATDEGLSVGVDLMGGLQVLALGGCKHLTDVGVACLGRMSSLEQLHLSDCPRLTDAGVAALLSRSPRLQRLSMSGCPGTTAQGAAAAGHEASKAHGRLVAVEWSRR